jgi:hypothetical protein
MKWRREPLSPGLTAVPGRRLESMERLETIRRSFKPTDLLPYRGQRNPLTPVREAMITQVVGLSASQPRDRVISSARLPIPSRSDRLLAPAAFSRPNKRAAVFPIGLWARPRTARVSTADRSAHCTTPLEFPALRLLGTCTEFLNQPNSSRRVA